MKSASYTVMAKDHLIKCVTLSLELQHELGEISSKHAAFQQIWNKAREQAHLFDYSPQALLSYELAQEALNEYVLRNPIDNAYADALGNAFEEVFIFESPLPLPDLNREQIEAFCLAEYGDDEGVDSMAAAHRFFQDGMREIKGDQVVVFTIE